jgi:hypothetical protein
MSTRATTIPWFTFFVDHFRSRDVVLLRIMERGWQCMYHTSHAVCISAAAATTTTCILVLLIGHGTDRPLFRPDLDVFLAHHVDAEICCVHDTRKQGFMVKLTFRS